MPDHPTIVAAKDLLREWANMHDLSVTFCNNDDELGDAANEYDWTVDWFVDTTGAVDASDACRTCAIFSMVIDEDQERDLLLFLAESLSLDNCVLPQQGVGVMLYVPLTKE